MVAGASWITIKGPRRRPSGAQSPTRATEHAIKETAKESGQSSRSIMACMKDGPELRYEGYHDE